MGSIAEEIAICAAGAKGGCVGSSTSEAVRNGSSAGYAVCKVEIEVLSSSVVAHAACRSHNGRTQASIAGHSSALPTKRPSV